MAFLTLDELRQYPYRFSQGQRATARQNMTTKTASTRTTVFLSHSHRDADLVEPAYLLPKGGVLLDCFAGSGTMLLAGLDFGESRVIGIEKQKKYLKIAEKRLCE